MPDAVCVKLGAGFTAPRPLNELARLGVRTFLSAISSVDSQIPAPSAAV